MFRKLPNDGQLDWILTALGIGIILFAGLAYLSRHGQTVTIIY